MRYQLRLTEVLTGLSVCLASLAGLAADSGDGKATRSRTSSGVQQASHSAIDPWHAGGGWGWTEPEPYALPSKYYGPWEPTEIFGRDARCAPTPFAPRGYGFPKKLSPYRMDYTPYRLHDCAMDSVHGPSLWWRVHRDPCCDPAFGGCRKCDPAVDPQ